jgi:hypothetical protein
VKAALLLTACLAVAGCAQSPRPLYGWGGYQAQVYEYFKSTASAPEQQIAAIEADLQRMRADNLTPGPGVHAHLGMLYAHLGRDDAAQREFNTEKALYPEAARFLDGLLARAQRKEGGT